MSKLKDDILGVVKKTQNGEDATLELQIEGETYYRHFRPKERLLILGGGHVSQPVCEFASRLGFEVTVADDRPSFANKALFPDASSVLCMDFASAINTFKVGAYDYVVTVTRGHRYDADCLRVMLKGTFPRYLGMIGSRRRTIGLLNMLEEEGYDRQLLDRIHTPIGIPIGALTTDEIAISIIAELISIRRQDTNRRSKSHIMVAEDIDWNLMQFLNSDKKKAVLIAFESSGSTPAKSGAWMAVDEDFQNAGTIGGGCSENEILRRAALIIGTGESCVVNIDMSHDVAEEEGMVCGGHMKVFVADLN